MEGLKLYCRWTRGTEGHEDHGHYAQEQNKLTVKLSVPGWEERLPAVGHTIVLVCFHRP